MSGQPSEIDNDGLRAVIEADPLTPQKIGEELKCQPFYSHLVFEANYGGEKAQ